MGYGVTSATLLVAGGMAPAAASAAIHFSEIGTSLVSGISHHALGNTDWRTVGVLAAPGFLGAFAGATLLVNLDADVAVPVVATVLVGLGVYVTARFLSVPGRRLTRGPRPSARLLAPLGLVAGALDAVGGGGWGRGRHLVAPRLGSPSSPARWSARSTPPSSWSRSAARSASWWAWVRRASPGRTSPR